MRRHVEVAGAYRYLCGERGEVRRECTYADAKVISHPVFFFNLIAQLINAHTLTPPPR